jgi:hypothetical protein
MSSITNTHPKETAELIHFLCAAGKSGLSAFLDDRRVSVTEALGMLALLKGAMTGFAGAEKIPAEMADLTEDEARQLTDIPAEYFHTMLPHQHRLISEAALACIPTLVRLLQTIRLSAALAAEFPGAAPKATPA